MLDLTIPQNYWTGKGLLELGVPWLTPNAVRAIEYILEPSFSVLEFGSGGSTVFFARRCRKVVSWENNRSWCQSVARRLALLGLENCLLTDSLNEAQSSGAHDLVLVDSSGVHTDRQSLCRSARNQVKPGGWLVLDNYGRYNLNCLDGWLQSRHDDPHWSGRGTLIAHHP